MAAMRARRSAGRRGHAPAPPPAGVPRLAYMKLEGARRVADSFKVMGTARNVQLMLASAVIIAGAAVAGAAWIGGSLFDARETLARAADDIAVQAGFAVERPILVSGVGDARAAEVRAVALPEGRASLFAATPASVKERVERLPWVARATVRRYWPSTVRIDVTRRPAYALWRHDGATTVIDAAGAPVGAAYAHIDTRLPVLEGEASDESALQILVALENMPDVRARLDGLVRVGHRRWNLQMKSGMIVALPQADALGALHTLAALHERYRLLDRPLARVDLRVPNKMVVLPRGVLAGGPGLADEASGRLSAGA